MLSNPPHPDCRAAAPGLERPRAEAFKVCCGQRLFNNVKPGFHIGLGLADSGCVPQCATFDHLPPTPESELLQKHYRTPIGWMTSFGLSTTIIYDNLPFAPP